MSQTVYRVVKDRSNPYVMLNKDFLSDDALSWKAKGMLAYLLSKPDDWKVIEADLVARSTDGRDAVRAAMRELVAAGYVVRRQTHSPRGRFGASEYHVYEQPVGSGDVPLPPITENPSTVNPPQTEIPSTGNPSPEKPSPENHPLLSNERTKERVSPSNDLTNSDNIIIHPGHENERPQYDPRYHPFYVKSGGTDYAAYMDAHPEYVAAVRQIWYGAFET